MVVKKKSASKKGASPAPPKAAPKAVPAAAAPAPSVAPATPVAAASAGPSIPLAPDVRAAYQALYDKLQAAIDSTMDLATVQLLNQWWPQVEQVLTEDNLYRLDQNTAIFASLQKQIRSVNDGLTTLRSQVSAIANHFALAGDILAAIDKVLSFV